jgi:hypothetical protein
LPRHYATLRRQPLAPPPLKASFHYADGWFHIVSSPVTEDSFRQRHAISYSW